MAGGGRTVAGGGRTVTGGDCVMAAGGTGCLVSSVFAGQDARHENQHGYSLPQPHISSVENIAGNKD